MVQQDAGTYFWSSHKPLMIEQLSMFEKWHMDKLKRITPLK